MDLILWRHAEAEEGSDDLARELTRKGQQQASRMAAWLRPRLPRDYTLLVSEARRSQQTAAFLAKGAEVMPALNPGASAEEVLGGLGWPRRDGTVVVVGHQPWIGWLTAKLMAGEQQMWSVKKGAVWWLQHRQRDEFELVRLKVMMTPSMLDS
ncbi:histidine phosphatase family protein [Crenobacter sp. SG2303]|uniref:Histidine phosphatase family protein n=1 Tax=Crenobacter oryzisoli TaxID=3056844 RepID=A0ABT7XHU6_9NEIS|nr:MULTISPECIES: histidine phosphatase family protein [unclassified Crenobacter]MDN0073347.1 histidine phosphatase family protein [Crenobacter sp. SG2303]MDN0084473.1 histidine phosphatase family protein [Crenobacter sp. SG2305]